MRAIKSIYFSIAILVIAVLVSSCQTTQGPSSISSNIQAHLDLANSHLNKQNPRKGLRELLPLKQKAADIPEYHFLLGMTYLQLQKTPKAIEQFKQATSLRPDYGKAWNNLGQAYIRMDRIEQAKKAYKKALDIETYLTPEYPAYNLAKLYWSEEKIKPAIKFSRRSLEKNWRFIPAYILISKLYTRQGKLAKANKWLKKGVEANPKATELILKLAKNHLRLGHQKDARYWFKKIREINPQTRSAQVASDYLETLPKSQE